METLTFCHGLWPEAKRSWRSCRQGWPLLGVVVAILLFACAASAQVIPDLVTRPSLSIFGTLPANLTPDFAPLDSSVLFGYSLGGFLQSGHIIGVEIRGSIQRRLNAQHQESALAGPRFALHFGRVKPYTSLLFGAGNGWRFQDSPPSEGKLPKPVEGKGAQWTVAGGVDLQISRHFSARVGEISYSELYPKRWNLTPVNVTAGVVWRLK